MSAWNIKPPSPRKVAWCNYHKREMTIKDIDDKKCLGGRCVYLLRYGEQKEIKVKSLFVRN